MHNIPFDDLSFSNEKFRWCAQSKYYDSNAISFALDDSPKHAMDYTKHGIDCYVPKKSYNVETWSSDGVVAYNDISSLFDLEIKKI